MRLRSACLVAVLVAGAGCSSGPVDKQDAATDAPPSVDEATVQGGTPNVRLTSIVSLSSPIAMAMRSGDEDALYIAQQTGRVVRVRLGEVTGTVLNIADLVSCCGEQGLLGITFSPNGNRLYVDYTDNGGDTIVAWFRMDGRRAVRASRLVMLEVNQPYSNHNGGDIYLNPTNGFLYIALGDGGSQDDPSGNGQDRNVLLGKILRIDPTPDSGRYSSPPSNPFVGRTGRDEILHYGLRNPWRFSIDPETQVMWIGDVGQNTWEEIDRIPANEPGANLGWDRMEGLHTHEGSEPSNHRRPIYEYSHQRGGCAITGGYVMRDPRLPGLDGTYIYSDYCDGLIRTLQRSDGRWVGGSLGISASGVASFGVGPGERMFVLSHGSGRVYRIDPPDASLRSVKLRISRTSELGCSLDALIAYHEHPDTFARLAPPWQRMRIIERSGGIAPGARTIFRGWIGPVPFTWIAEHVEHDGHGFTDVMRRGPLRAWTHVHRFEATSTGSRLTDEITLEVPAPSFARTRIEHEIGALLRYRHTVTADDLLDPGPTPMRIAVTGASGLIGSRLCARLRIRGHTVIPLVRRAPMPGEVRWNPEGAWDASPLEGIDAVVHLAGESIGARLRWTDETKRRILESRRRGTASLAEGLAGLRAKPRALVSTSAVGIYGDRGDDRLTETSPLGDGFLADVCRDWEAAADPARAAGIRVAHPRIGYVIAAKSGAIKPLVWLTLLGAGGPLGGGRHRMAWISLHDVTRALEFLVTEPIEGPVNVTGPDPVPQRALARTLAQLLHRPALLPAPGWAIRLILGELGDELLKSQRAMPERLRAAGFRFRHDTLRAALADELGR